MEAIRSYTMDSAHSGFEEARKGSIEKRKLADLIALFEDPLTAQPDEIRGIKVVTIPIGGNVVWTSER